MNKGLKQHKEAKGSAKMRKVLLGWLHFDEEKQSLVSVRTAKGGGTREVDIKLNAGKLILPRPYFFLMVTVSLGLNT